MNGIKSRTWLRMYYKVSEILQYEMWTATTHSFVSELLTLRRLAKKHHRLAEMACNGEGWIGGKLYSWNAGQATYGYMAAYKPNEGLAKDTTVFDVESDKVEAKIKVIADRLGLRVEFQGDPRGYTVKVYKGERFIDIQA